MKYFVSRQIYWPDGTKMVEVAVGGQDFANAGMLVPKYRSLGEGQEFEDPREAVVSAIQIYAAWSKTTDDVEIGKGCTMGFTMPFDGATIESLRLWAEEEYSKLPKCAHCAGVLGREKYGSHELHEFDCCSEHCATAYYFYDHDVVDAEDPELEVMET